MVAPHLTYDRILNLRNYEQAKIGFREVDIFLLEMPPFVLF